MTAWEMYWLSILDFIKVLSAIFGTFFLILSMFATVVQSQDRYWLYVATLIFFLVAVFIPCSNTAMKMSGIEERIKKELKQ